MHISRQYSVDITLGSTYVRFKAFSSISDLQYIVELAPPFLIILLFVFFHSTALHEESFYFGASAIKLLIYPVC